eukprot:snap_masked-scaffold_30-processed-gene-1.8-mRNA-1 protein AED:1.00 eAED:1.00 QI:0/0/0/0/1/1/2/0/79
MEKGLNPSSSLARAESRESFLKTRGAFHCPRCAKVSSFHFVPSPLSFFYQVLEIILLPINYSDKVWEIAILRTTNFVKV